MSVKFLTSIGLPMFVRGFKKEPDARGLPRGCSKRSTTRPRGRAGRGGRMTKFVELAQAQLAPLGVALATRLEGAYRREILLECIPNRPHPGSGSDLDRGIVNPLDLWVWAAEKEYDAATQACNIAWHPTTRCYFKGGAPHYEVWVADWIVAHAPAGQRPEWVEDWRSDPPVDWAGWKPTWSAF